MYKYIIFFLLICACSSQNSKESTDLQENFSDQNTELTINSLRLVDMTGIEVPTSIFEGKPVFVNLWATWCGPCIKEMPAIQRAMKKLKGDGKELIFIFPSNESLSKIKKFKENKGFDFQFYKLENSFEELGVYTLPTTLIFDKEGKLLQSIVGAQEWDSEDAVQSLSKLVY